MSPENKISTRRGPEIAKTDKESDKGGEYKKPDSNTKESRGSKESITDSPPPVMAGYDRLLDPENQNTF